MNENGFVKLFRKLVDWKYAQFPNAVALWVHILIRANWKDGYFMGVPIPRGSFATSLQRLAGETGMNVSTVRRWLKKFEDDKQIERIVTQRCTIIKVSNYRDYQDISEEGVNTPVNTLMNKQMNNQVNTQVNNNRRSKEEKEIKKVRNREGLRSPSLPEVERYFKEHGYKAEPFPFWEYYNRREWKDQNGRQLDWMLKAGDWEAREKQIYKGEERIVIPDPFKNHNEDDTGEWWEGLLDGK